MNLNERSSCEPAWEPAAQSAGEAAELLIRFGSWSRRVALGDAPLVLGRAEDCDVQLPDRSLSRRHCRVQPVRHGVWQVEDLGSQGGTFVGGAAIREAVELRPGQSFRIGPMEVRLETRPAGTAVLSGDPARDARNVELLLRTVDDLYGTEDLDGLLRTIVDRALQLASAERGALLLSDAGKPLEALVARDASGRDLPLDETLTSSLPARALQSRRAVVLTDAEASGAGEAVPQSVLDGRLRSVLCVPLPGRAGPMGVLYVDAQGPAQAFGPAELAVYEALAVHGALAIERGWLRREQEHREREARQRLESENRALKARLPPEAPLGQSEAMHRALEVLRRVAPTDATVCLIGQTGTGKEVLARYLHGLSARAQGPFVAVDCGAIPEGLIESELFGHEKGAYTGAAEARKGRFREAQGGTVFLDEIGELPLSLQSRLLRVLQERTVQPVGGARSVSVDVRVVCATHRDLQRLVAEGGFREDLYYRIAVLAVPVPPLRDRGGDVLLLAQHFLMRFAAAYGTGVCGFTREALEALQAYAWPGNVRELENRVQRAVLLARPPYATRADLELGADGLPGPAEAELPVQPLSEARAEAVGRFERAYLEHVLQQTQGNVTKAAALAGVSTQLLWRLMRKYGIDRARFRAEA